MGMCRVWTNIKINIVSLCSHLENYADTGKCPYPCKHVLTYVSLAFVLLIGHGLGICCHHTSFQDFVCGILIMYKRVPQRGGGLLFGIQ